MLENEIIYKCVDSECGCEVLVLAHRKDGNRCPACNAEMMPKNPHEHTIEPLNYHGQTYPNSKFNVVVSLRDTDIFEGLLDVTKYLIDNTNEEVRKIAIEKINGLLNKEDIK